MQIFDLLGHLFLWKYQINKCSVEIGGRESGREGGRERVVGKLLPLQGQGRRAVALQFSGNCYHLLTPPKVNNLAEDSIVSIREPWLRRESIIPHHLWAHFTHINNNLEGSSVTLTLQISTDAIV